LEDPGFGTCFFLAEPGCRATTVIEFSPAGGVSDSHIGSQSIFRGVMAVGLLAPVPGTRAELHFGPELDLGFDVGESTSDWTVSSKARARWYVAGTLFVIEGSGGLVFERFAFHDALETGTRVGTEWDLALGFGGIVGPFATGAVLGDLTGRTDTNLRLTAGVRMNLMAWAAVLVGPFALADWL
jgi:hypothetical protein